MTLNNLLTATKNDRFSSIEHEAALEAAAHDPKRPGKFEDEEPATVYYHYLFMEGCYYAMCEHSILCEVSSEEAKAFNIEGYPFYELQNTEAGFILGAPVKEERCPYCEEN